MKDKYIKPVIVINDDVCEGIYAASGDTNGGNGMCASKYMNGVHRKPTWQWNTPTIERKGCNGCHYSQGGDQYCGKEDQYLQQYGPSMPRWELDNEDPYALSTN